MLRPAAPPDDQLRAIASAFEVPWATRIVEPYGSGLINDTYRVEAGTKHYLLQRINTAVFPDPQRIAANIQALSLHASRQQSPGLRIPALIPTQGGQLSLRDTEGHVWRLMEFIEDAVTLARIERPEQGLQIGALLGRFHTLVQSLPPDAVGVSLPGFHDTPGYLARFMAILPQAGRLRGDAEVEACIKLVMARRRIAARLAEAHAQGRIPLRVMHGDPKLDNILLGRADGRGLALIDLDTLQPGLILQDVGDCLRSCCNRSGESAHGHSQVSFDLALAEPILNAYAQETRDWLTADEIDLIGEAIRLMPFELGLRFLTDHLEGDRYFKVSERGQNLDKAQIQFALVQDIEKKAGEIRGLVDACFGRGEAPRP
ncbi:MAG: aminoglycoside phosphotransferase family protein [Thiocapsa sp.]|nr:aminoglycoside phosphotransferase family protein [Thiocapsa sp.]MCG6985375.1 aminoglycoside phosphotransferase family protein [Thiocapsa sp.]